MRRGIDPPAEQPIAADRRGGLRLVLGHITERFRDRCAFNALRGDIPSTFPGLFVFRFTRLGEALAARQVGGDPSGLIDGSRIH